METTTIRACKVNSLASLIDYNYSTVVSKEIMETSNGGVYILAFKQGQKLNQHPAPAEVLIQAIEGKVVFTVDTTPHELRAGDFMILPTGTLHSVKAMTDAKILLTKIAD